MVDQDQIREAMKQVDDPELGINVVDLGLLYEVNVDEATGKVELNMTLTSMGCPVGPMIQEQIVETVEAMSGIEKCEPNLVWDPAWTPERMSEDAKFILGFG